MVKSRTMHRQSSHTAVLIYLLFMLGCGQDISMATSLQAEVLSTFRDWCPYTDTCTAAGVVFPPQNDTREVECCTPCRCDRACAAECCPDAPGVDFRPPPPQPETLVSCISAHYRDDAGLMQRGMTVNMVSRCPHGYNNHDVIDKCRQDYDDVDIIESLEDLPPVTTKTFGITYKNKWCALCNNLTRDRLISWKIQLECQHDPPFFPSTNYEIAKIVGNASNECNLVFVPRSEVDMFLEFCNGVIDRCNVTGYWDVYDADVAKACNSYTAGYNLKYKNVHCYLCNSRRNVSVTTVCKRERPAVGPNTFIALMDFNQLETKDKPDSQVRCLPSKIYDSIKERCLPMSCTKGFRLIGDSCVPLYTSVASRYTNIIYGLTFKLVPLQPTPTQTLDMVTTKDSLMASVYHALSSVVLGPCAVYSFIRINTSVGSLLADMHAARRQILISDVESIALRVTFMELAARNVTETVGRISQSMIFNLSEFTAAHSYIEDIRFIEAVSALEDQQSELNPDDISMLVAMDLPPITNMSIAFGHDASDNKGILPFISLQYINDYSVSFEVDSSPICPKVRLSVSQYDISIDDRQVKIKEAGGSLVKETVVLSENGSDIYVCSKDFLKIVSNHPSRLDTTVFSHTALSILTIVLYSLSLLALVITLTVYCVFPTLRTVPGLNNMGLVISLIFVYSLGLVNVTVDIRLAWLCRAVGVSLHFSLLSSFGWMFICTLHMARVFSSISERATTVNNVKQFVRYFLFVEICACVIVVATILVAHFTSEGDSVGYVDEPCYTDPGMMVFNVAIPAGLMILVNLAMFLYVVITISRLPDVHKNSTHERDNIAIFVKLSSLTGLTWVSAFVYQFTAIEAFAYITTVVNASQGVFIMLSFVVNRRVYNMCCNKRLENTSTAKSTRSTKATNFSSIEYNKA